MKVSELKTILNELVNPLKVTKVLTVGKETPKKSD